MDNNKYVKAWLNYNCSQGNNWIVMYKFDEIISHEGRRYFKVSGNQLHQMELDTLKVTSKDLSHIYFTHMTDSMLITLVEMYDGELYLISNKVNIIDPSEEETPVETDQHATIDLTDEVIDQYLDKQTAVKKVDNVLPLPQLESIESNIYKLDNVSQIRSCLTRKDRKLIGIKDSEWLSGQLKKIQKDELNHLSFMDFIHVAEMDRYVPLLDQYIDQLGDTLNLMYNYSVTSEKLIQVKDHHNIKQLILYQNFQINDFAWLKKFPNIKLLNLLYSHQLEQKHFEQITQILPELEVVNIHFCSRINVRVLIPLLKLRNLAKLAIDDSQFWCQKSVHELFILPHEWKNVFCPSLQKVAVNSYNLTMDIIDYLLASCPNINQMTVDENVLKLLSKNIEGGLEKTESIIFNSWQNPNKGFKVQKKMFFKNLLKDTYNSQLFSDSMLKKIKEIRAKKGEIEQTSMDDKPLTDKDKQ